MAKCSSCGAEILWAKTALGKSIPLDAKGETRLVLLKNGGNFDAETNNEVTIMQTYATHFATCPNAAQHRKVKLER
jgi:hypothetical protein